MAKRKKAALRPGAQRRAVYNEGLCVYVHDEGHDAALRAMMASPDFGEQAPEATFYERLDLPDFGSATARAGLAFAFELQQDDEIDVEVMVGLPLELAQLADALWLAPQTTWLRLPTGRLRIDTPNTMPLDPEPGHDPGGIVQVPPGDYEVRLYRVDWDAMHREEREDGYKGPGHLLVLTPLAGSAPPGLAVLPFPVAPDAPLEESACRVDGARLETRVTSDYWWEPFHLEVDRAAAAALGLTPGSLFELTWDKPKFALTVAFLDRRCDKEMAVLLGDRAPSKDLATKLDQLAAAHPDVAVALWTTDPESQREHLLLVRWKGKKKYPAKLHGVWAPCTGRRLDEPSSLADLLARSESPAARAVDPARLQDARREAETALRDFIQNVEQGIEDARARPKGLSRSDLYEIRVDQVSVGHANALEAWEELADLDASGADWLAQNQLGEAARAAKALAAAVKEHWSTPDKQPPKIIQAARDQAQALRARADELRAERARSKPPPDSDALEAARAKVEGALRELVQHLARLIQDAGARPAGVAAADWLAATRSAVNATAMRVLTARKKLADLDASRAELLEDLPVPEAANAVSELAGLVRKHWAKPAKQPAHATDAVRAFALTFHARADDLRGERTAPPPELQ
jgi:hypothetical protein